MKAETHKLVFLLAGLLSSAVLVGCTSGPGMLRSNPRSHNCGDPACADPYCSDLSEFAMVDDPACAPSGSCAPEGCGDGFAMAADNFGEACAEPMTVNGVGSGLAACAGPGAPCAAVAAGKPCLGGCQGGVQHASFQGPSPLPRELDKTTLPRHVIEAPDILLIEAVDNLRLESSRLQAGDSLIVQVGQTLPVDRDEGRVDQLFKVVNGVYSVNVDGYIDLGPEYGKVLMDGLTLDEARARMDQHLRRTLQSPKLYLAFANARTRQLISGQHLVRSDGTVSLGIYGSVYVTGSTIEEAQFRIQQHLAAHIHRPQVSVDVLAYNSKFYYVIADGGGAGEQVIKLPCTGNETVLDAIANIRGLPTVASKSEIWIARPAPAGTGASQRLRVHWNDIARNGVTDTNYQLLPGDRLYVKADDLIVFDTWVAKITAPWERIFGFTILGNGTVRALQRGRAAQGGGGGGIGF
ncbi:MAG: polysaccharide biosynthesis/export family protein [Planctomycetaceae bacterium]